MSVEVGLVAGLIILIMYVGNTGSWLRCVRLFAQRYQTSVHIAPGVYWSATGVVTMVSILLGLWLQRCKWIQLTHRRKEPYYFRCSSK